MGLDEPASKNIANHQQQRPKETSSNNQNNNNPNIKFRTTEHHHKKPSFPQSDVKKYATAPADKKNLDKKIFVSLISQAEYMKRHLYIKSGVDRDRPVLRYQVKKVSLRNYTPKTIDQDINMGMWI